MKTILLNNLCDYVNTGTAACYRCTCYNTAKAVSGFDLYFAAYLRD